MLTQYIGNEDTSPWRDFHSDAGNTVIVQSLLPPTNGVPDAAHSRQPNGNVFPHYHLAAQFQLVSKGSAKYPDFTLNSIGVHYTDHCTPYGPFTTSEDYVHYVVHTKPGPVVKIETRAARDKINRRGREIAVSGEDIEWTRMPDHEGFRRKVLFREPSGVGVEIVEFPPNAELKLKGSDWGRYEVVVEGTAFCGDEEIRTEGLRYTEGDETPTPLKSGPDGATIVILEYDQDAERSYVED